MSVNDIVLGPAERLDGTFASFRSDLLREMIKGFAQRMMDTNLHLSCAQQSGR